MPSSRREKLKRSLESETTPLEDGQMVDSSLQLEHQLVNAFTTSNNSLLPITKKRMSKKSKKSATVESLQQVKKTTCIDKFCSCHKPFQTTKSLQTLDQESISEERVLPPCWTLHAKDLSPKLWLPTETDYVDSPLNWWNGSFQTIKSNSWFSIKAWNPQKMENWQKTCWPSSTFSIAESTEEESTKVKGSKKTAEKQPKNVPETKPKGMKPRTKVPPNSCTRVKLVPKPEVAQMLKRWFGTVRYTYNWALGCMTKKPKSYKINAFWLRKRFINECNIPLSKRWILDTPKHVRDGAIQDLVQGYKTNFEKKKLNPEHKFCMKFRSKKENQSIVIPYDAIKQWKLEKDKGEVSMYPTFLKNKILFYTRNLSSNLPSDVKFDCRLTLNKLGAFHLCIPTVKACENQTSNDNWCAIDPGVRTGWTVYSPTPGVCYKFGDKDISRIYRLCTHLDMLISNTANTHGAKRLKKGKLRRKGYRMRRAQERARQRIKFLVDDVHWKTINFLTNQFSNIIIPPFEVSNMVSKTTRKISKKSVRQMLSWKHFTFRQRLLYKAKLKGVNVFVRGESWTSKTCTNCFKIHHTLGGNKTFKCPYCNVQIERDASGARNIFLRNALGS
jgi:putative transposase